MVLCLFFVLGSKYILCVWEISAIEIIQGMFIEKQIGMLIELNHSAAFFHSTTTFSAWSRTHNVNFVPKGWLPNASGCDAFPKEQSHRSASHSYRNHPSCFLLPATVQDFMCSLLPVTVQDCMAVSTAGLPRTSHLGQPLTSHRSKFQTDNHSKISHSGYIGLPNYKQNTIWFCFNSF